MARPGEDRNIKRSAGSQQLQVGCESNQRRDICVCINTVSICWLVWLLTNQWTGCMNESMNQVARVAAWLTEWIYERVIDWTNARLSDQLADTIWPADVWHVFNTMWQLAKHLEFKLYVYVCQIDESLFQFYPSAFEKKLKYLWTVLLDYIFIVFLWINSARKAICIKCENGRLRH